MPTSPRPTGEVRDGNQEYTGTRFPDLARHVPTGDRLRSLCLLRCLTAGFAHKKRCLSPQSPLVRRDVARVFFSWSNCSVSVEPSMAVVELSPPVATFVTSSKYPVPTNC